MTRFLTQDGSTAVVSTHPPFSYSWPFVRIRKPIEKSRARPLFSLRDVYLFIPPPFPAASIYRALPNLTFFFQIVIFQWTWVTFCSTQRVILFKSDDKSRAAGTKFLSSGRQKMIQIDFTPTTRANQPHKSFRVPENPTFARILTTCWRDDSL